MEIKKEKLSNSRIKLSVEVPVKDVDKFFNEAYKRLAEQVEIPGFRRGKAPHFMIDQEVGLKRVQEQAMEIAVAQTYFQAVSSEKIMPIAKPEVKILKFAKDNPLIYEAVISIMPEIVLDDYKKKISSLSLKPGKISIEQKEIDEALAGLQKSKAEFIPSSKPIDKGDRVEVDFDGFIKGIPLEGGKSRNHPLVIGEGMFVPGFEDNLIGMKKDEKKEFFIVFPKEYHKKEIAGKKIDFKVQIKDIKNVRLPSLDDKLAKETAKIDSISELKEDIKKRLQIEKENKQKMEFESKIIEKVTEFAKTEIPEVLIEEEINSIISELKNRLESQGLKLEQYLKNVKKKEEDLRKEYRKEAEKRIKTALVLSKIAQDEKIEVTDKEIQNEIDNMMKMYPQDKTKIKEKFSSDKDQQYIKNNLRNQKTIKRLVELVDSK